LSPPHLREKDLISLLVIGVLEQDVNGCTIGLHLGVNLVEGTSDVEDGHILERRMIITFFKIETSETKENYLVDLLVSGSRGSNRGSKLGPRSAL
jgi:hypothetical protein